MVDPSAPEFSPFSSLLSSLEAGHQDHDVQSL